MEEVLYRSLMGGEIRHGDFGKQMSVTSYGRLFLKAYNADDTAGNEICTLEAKVSTCEIGKYEDFLQLLYTNPLFNEGCLASVKKKFLGKIYTYVNQTYNKIPPITLNDLNKIPQDTRDKNTKSMIDISRLVNLKEYVFDDLDKTINNFKLLATNSRFISLLEKRISLLPLELRACDYSLFILKALCSFFRIPARMVYGSTGDLEEALEGRVLRSWVELCIPTENSYAWAPAPLDNSDINHYYYECRLPSFYLGRSNFFIGRAKLRVDGRIGQDKLITNNKKKA